MGKSPTGKEGQHTKYSLCFWEPQKEVTKFPQPE